VGVADSKVARDQVQLLQHRVQVAEQRVEEAERRAHELAAVFGGYGIPTGPAQPGAKFTKDTHYTDWKRWSNKLHVFTVTKGMSALSVHF